VELSAFSDQPSASEAVRSDSFQLDRTLRQFHITGLMLPFRSSSILVAAQRKTAGVLSKIGSRRKLIAES
jgi:hypothetical protein